MLSIILYILAFVLFLVAAFIDTVATPPSWRVSLGWLALAFFTAGVLADKNVF